MTAISTETVELYLPKSCANSLDSFIFSFHRRLSRSTHTPSRQTFNYQNDPKEAETIRVFGVEISGAHLSRPSSEPPAASERALDIHTPATLERLRANDFQF